MSDEFEYDDETDDEAQTKDERNFNKLRRDLDRKAKEAAQNEQRATAAERKLAFFEAGVPRSKQSEYFVKAYDGEMTAEAIRAAAIDAGFLADEAANDVSASERATHERMANASTGATDPSYDHDSAIAAAETVEDILAASEKAGYPTIRTI